MLSRALLRFEIIGLSNKITYKTLVFTHYFKWISIEERIWSSNHCLWLTHPIFWKFSLVFSIRPVASSSLSPQLGLRPCTSSHISSAYGLTRSPTSTLSLSKTMYCTDHADGMESWTIVELIGSSGNGNYQVNSLYIASINTDCVLVFYSMLYIFICTPTPYFSSACGVTSPSPLARPTASPLLSFFKRYQSVKPQYRWRDIVKNWQCI